MNFSISALQEHRQLRTPGVSATDTSSKDLEIEREESRKTKQMFKVPGQSGHA